MQRSRWLGLAVVLFACGTPGPTTKPANEASVGPNPLAPLLEGLGEHHHPISSTVPLVDRYFDQGLVLAWAFNHAEAGRAFAEAARRDPNCAICLWGAAFVLGPNINAKMEPAHASEAWALLQKAKAAAGRASTKELGYIAALDKRYAENPPEDRSELDRAFAEAMRGLSAMYPDDLDAKTLLAEALMNLHPWDYWDARGEPKPWTMEFVTLLEEVLRAHPEHPGANHLYIHAVEASPHPEKALDAADRLGALVPAAGHLVHMPAHIYIRVGRYADASEANEKAIAADDTYATQCHRQGFYPMFYMPHNHHFLWATATLEGRSARAIEAAKETASGVPPDKASAHCLGFLQHYAATPLYAYVRFAKWDEVMAEPVPTAPYPLAVWHYARGMALTARGQVPKAQKELQELEKLARQPELEEITVFDINTSASLMKLAAKILGGEIAAKKKNFKKAIRELKEALKLEAALNYDEPPDWYYPVRHSLGAVLLEARKAKEAEKVYREDLFRNPENGFALFGLTQALTAQRKKKEAKETKARFEKAWAAADHVLTSSRW